MGKRQQEYYRKNKAKGLCSQCKQPRGIDGTESMCAACAKKQREYSREYYQQNKRRIYLRTAVYRRGHPEVYAKAKKKYFSKPKNREAARLYVAQWRDNNPDKLRKQWKLKCMRQREAEGTFTLKQLKSRIDYYGGLCYICSHLGKQTPFEEIDHVIPIAKGGTHWPANLRPICSYHNNSKKAKSLNEYLAWLEL